MEATQGIYRQRNPKASPLYKLVVEHFESLKSCYSARFEKTYGLWQPHWDVTVEKFLTCGDFHNGFARVYCDTCRHTYVRAYTCSARGFCPSCEARRRALWTEHVIENVLPRDMAYRMMVFTLPKAIRPMFLRERALLGDLSQAAYRCTRDFLCAQFPGIQGTPYFVCVIQSFGNLLNPNPHLHAVTSLGIRDGEGNLHHAPEGLDFSPLEESFRRATLQLLRKKERLSEKFHRSLSSWEHSGFSVNADVAVPGGNTADLERIVAYTLRPPLSLSRLKYVPGSRTAVYQGTSYHPGFNANFRVLDPLELLVLLLYHTPRPYEVLIRYFGAASSRSRSQEPKHDEEPLLDEGPTEDPHKDHRRPSSWARLIAKIYNTDHLLCPHCGNRIPVSPQSPIRP